MKRILILILISIAFFACSGPRGDSAGIINGKRIAYSDFIKSLQGHTANFQIEKQRKPDSDEKNAIMRETWRNITIHTILKDKFQLYDIMVSESETLDSLSLNIPAYLNNAPLLQDKDGFDKELYLQSLRYDTPMNMAPIRRNYQEYVIPIQKLKPKLIEHELLSPKETKKLSSIIYGTADFDIIVFDPARLKPIISNAEIENYYQQNLEQYQMEPIFGVKYISLPITLKDSDLEYSKAISDSIYLELSAGKSYDTLLAERKGNIPGLHIVDHGFAKVDTLDANILQLIDFLPEGGLSKPIPNGNGFAIHQKIQRTKSMLRYQTLEIPATVSMETVNSEYKRAMGALNLGKDMGLETAAVEMGAQYSVLNSLRQNSMWHPDKSVVDKVNSLLPKTKRNSFLDPIYSPATNAWLIVQLGENQVSRVYPLNDVRTSILQILTEKKQKSMAEQKANEWLKNHPNIQTSPDSEYQITSFQKAPITITWHDLNFEVQYLKAMQGFLAKNKPFTQVLEDKYIIIIPKALYPNPNAQINPSRVFSLYERSLPENWFDLWLETNLNKAKVQIFVK